VKPDGVSGTSPSLPRRGLPKADRADMFNFVRLFEPLVIRSMNLFTTTRSGAFALGGLAIAGVNTCLLAGSSIPLQQQIIFLLCRLMILRVDYTMLDHDKVGSCSSLA